MDRKGQINNSIISLMIAAVVVAAMGLVSITVFDSVETSLGNSLTSTTNTAGITFSNFTENTYDGFDLASNIPLIMFAGLLIVVVLGLTLYMKG